jgi:hypothetical protein
MGDPVWLCLFNADFSNKQCIKGNLRVKLLISDISEINVDKMEPKRLNLTTSPSGKNGLVIRPSIYFDSA